MTHMMTLGETARHVAIVEPDSITAGTTTSTYYSVAGYKRAMIQVLVGDMGTSGTLVVKGVAATDSSGTGKSDISGATTGTLTEGTDDNTSVLIDINLEELPGQTDSHIAVEYTVATAASEIAVVLWLYAIDTDDATTGADTLVKVN